MTDTHDHQPPGPSCPGPGPHEGCLAFGREPLPGELTGEDLAALAGLGADPGPG